MWHFLLNFRPAQTCSVVDPPLGASGDKGWKLANFYVLFASSNNIYVRAPPFTLYIQIRSKRDFLPSDQAFNVLLPCKVLLRCMVGCMESHLKREGVIWKSDWGPWFVFRFAIPARRYPHIFPTSILTNVSIYFLKVEGNSSQIILPKNIFQTLTNMSAFVFLSCSYCANKIRPG